MTFDNKYYKYLSIGEENKRWGIYITGAGNIMVNSNTQYPLIDDPSHHYFHYSIGRRLLEYQILYITKGEGIFDSELTGSRKIYAGDVFFLFPGIWHTFKPDQNTGWHEFWIEFSGEIIKYFRKNEFLNPYNPVITIGLQEDVASSYLKIIKLIKDGKPGFQYIASGILLQIIGQLFALRKYQSFEGKEIENQIKQAKLLILENMHKPISQEEIAMNVGIGYSLYRKKFKEYTGVSPAQYHIQMRINRAKDLLIMSNQSLKEISNMVGFESPDYFSRLFKKKSGMTPADFREKNAK